MITLAFILLFLGFYIEINTSKRAELPGLFKFENLIIQSPRIAKKVGYFILIISLALFIFLFGIGSGTLLFLVCLMTIASLVLLLNPIKLINYQTIATLTIVCLFLEFIIHH